MNNQLWQNAAEQFADLLEVESDERQVRLDELWSRDPVLASAVVQLLDGHEEESPLDELAMENTVLSAFKRQFRETPPDRLPEGQRIGEFEVLEKLGEGGMASVYRARRITEDFHQEVAIKILAPTASPNKFSNDFSSNGRLRPPWTIPISRS